MSDDSATEQPATNLMRHEPHAFWRSSRHTDRLPGVGAACLALQDQCGTDTNLLLYCCWLGTADRALDKHMLRRAMAAVARWQAGVIRPLRQVRRALKIARQDLPDEWAVDLRKRIGSVGVDLQYLEQCVLAKQAPEPAATDAPAVARGRASERRALPGAYGGATHGGRLATRGDRAGCLWAAAARAGRRERA